jgi:pyridoxine kinase
MARVLAISSHVVRGHVGLDATVPGLQALGHEVWSLPTVTFASRPGLGRMARLDPAAADLAALLAALEADGCWAGLDAVLTGYFPSANTVEVAADAVARIKSTSARVRVLVDPVLGDAGKLYVAPDTAAAIRDRLLPLADIATPNLFELGWLSGGAADRAGIIAAARRLGPATVVVTSALETVGGVTTLLVTPVDAVEHCERGLANIPNGAGDLFAGLLLGHLLIKPSLEAALSASLADLDTVLAASAGKPVLDLAALPERAP